MIIAYVVLFILFLIDCKPQFVKQGINASFLSKEQTTPIKGLFVILVFFRHFRGYVDMDHGVLNHLFVMLDSRSSQLIVTMFFFYSGYGIFEQLKRNGEEYSKNFVQHRIIPTYVNFAGCVLIYFLICTIKGLSFSAREIVLSFLGWNDDFGNSNWFMFVTFGMYLLFYLSFVIQCKKTMLNPILFNVLTMAFIVFLFMYKKHYWYNTILCFNLGMWYSYFRENVEAFLSTSKNYLIVLAISLFAFIVAFFLIETQSPLFIIKALLFSLSFVLIQMKFSFGKSRILSRLGKHVFSVYMLQRIPFMLLTELNLNRNIYLFFIITLFLTMLISMVYDYIFAFVSTRILRRTAK